MRWRVVRCAIYTRQSVTRPGDSDFTSCDAQREACREFIRQRADAGWIAISHRFDDEGESGATLIRRALGVLLQWVEARAVDRGVGYRLDRLTRKVLDWARLVAMFREAGTELSVVTGNLHHGMFAAGDLTLNLSVSFFAELERDIIVARLRDAHAARRHRGLRSAGHIRPGRARRRRGAHGRDQSVAVAAQRANDELAALGLESDEPDAAAALAESWGERASETSAVVDARRVSTELDARTSAIHTEVQRLGLTQQPDRFQAYVALVTLASALRQAADAATRRTAVTTTITLDQAMGLVPLCASVDPARALEYYEGAGRSTASTRPRSCRRAPS
jgi:DNA invertase Pin-like site-specific DNA recombinase